MERRWLELGVGTFMIIGLSCLAYVSLTLGDVNLWGGNGYIVKAKFSNIVGLKEKASVSMAGVDIGYVQSIGLDKGQAVVVLNIKAGVRLEDDVIASIKTMGIIGDKYIAISPGASDNYLKDGGTIQQTQPPLDIEDMLGRFVFGSMEKVKEKD